MKNGPLSDLRWLPSHWEAVQLRRLISVQSGDILPASEETSDGVPLVGGNGMRGYTHSANSPADSLVIGRVGAHCGNVHHVLTCFWATEHAFRVSQKTPTAVRYLYWALTALDLNRFAIRTAQPLLNTTLVESQWLALPPFAEQSVIAAFLDRETARIDALIAEQERLIALLQEKRQAVMSHAVTKGLDPNVPMKDSGVEWIGEVPAHWEVLPLKRATSFTTGWTPPTGREDFYGGDHFWANIGDLGPKFLSATEKTVTDLAVREARLRIVPAGSLLFSFKLSVGTVSLTAVDMYTNEAIAAFLPSPRVDTKYLYWAAPVLVPMNAQENIYGAPLLSRERIANAMLALPPLEEQRVIAAALDEKSERIDGLVSRCERAITLLRERRSALITAAVTGQIDVRGLVEPAA